MVRSDQHFPLPPYGDRCVVYVALRGWRGLVVCTPVPLMVSPACPAVATPLEAPRLRPFLRKQAMCADHDIHCAAPVGASARGASPWLAMGKWRRRPMFAHRRAHNRVRHTRACGASGPNRLCIRRSAARGSWLAASAGAVAPRSPARCGAWARGSRIARARSLPAAHSLHRRSPAAGRMLDTNRTQPLLAPSTTDCTPHSEQRRCQTRPWRRRCCRRPRRARSRFD